MTWQIRMNNASNLSGVFCMDQLSGHNSFLHCERKSENVPSSNIYDPCTCNENLFYFIVKEKKSPWPNMKPDWIFFFSIFFSFLSIEIPILIHPILTLIGEILWPLISSVTTLIRDLINFLAAGTWFKAIIEISNQIYFYKSLQIYIYIFSKITLAVKPKKLKEE